MRCFRASVVAPTHVPRLVADPARENTSHDDKPSQYEPVHHVDLQCRADPSTEVASSARGASQHPRAIQVATAGLRGGSYAWTGGAREAAADNVRAPKDAGSSVATEATTGAGEATTRFMSTALAIDATRSSWSPLSQNPAIHVGSGGAGMGRRAKRNQRNQQSNCQTAAAHRRPDNTLLKSSQSC